MQALIDFDGWRKWKDFSTASSSTGNADASASGAAPSASSQANGAPAKTKRKPITIRRKKDSVDKTDRKGSAEGVESVISRAMSPVPSRSRDDSGTTDAEGRKSESGASSSPSVRDKSSSDASGGSAGPLPATQSAENGMSTVPEHANGTAN